MCSPMDLQGCLAPVRSASMVMNIWVDKHHSLLPLMQNRAIELITEVLLACSFSGQLTLWG